jgi:hypothetical protein
VLHLHRPVFPGYCHLPQHQKFSEVPYNLL